ncbi:hypothetical protein PQ455_08415 [Sphingomonas naphthae]|uniref:Uncharacterized protein n=1 Tax=Sphingomonas naphthae TaxID=1813468 RepID=A0ABY7TQK8_9SPHN|nr:hypothetical protein [Sphingomonas naphthae]WCT75225.1 hypothetical protein PQ455_08415 [Sphingomonas naphthae]
MSAHPFTFDPDTATPAPLGYAELRAVLTARQAASTTGRIGRPGAATATAFDGSFSPSFAAGAAADGAIVTNGKGMSPAFLPWRFNLP